MTTEDVKKNQLKTRETRWKPMVWTIYKVDDQGKYETTLERYDDHLVATVPFADASQEQAEEVKQRVLRNESSPIEYFMYKRLLDPKALAQAMGVAVWRLKRHFKPKVFKKLDRNKLQEYAKIFNVQVDDLINFREDA
ncbi:MAG: helix-turn-helix domain-containing protein [Syntrophus sp. (in: bacteria)]